ncbi:MAG: tetratricopeptide repeat protein [Bacteroidales bacterium]|nr:tetratricopeptide repeat protein [Bacteroidales bacterium]
MIFLLASACSTKKNKWNRRVYHNLTAHYNAYYNGEVSLDEAIVEIKDAHKDDYTQILDVFELATNEDVQAAYPKLDRSILKASLVVHKHSMFFGKKENVKWVYYSYLMIGQARFYKHEYGIAKQVFQYIVTKYPKETVKYDAKMWIALVQGIQGDYDDAISNLDGIKNRVSQGLTSKEVYKMIPMVYADVYIKSKNYEAAIPYLKLAIDRNNKKAVRARLLFILGQVQQEREKLKGASRFFAKVLKNNPSYEMDFNARIKMAECYTGGDSKEVYKQLNKMLKDIKNEDYLDQIYYALAQVALKEKHTKEAMGYLKKSVQTSTTNNKQKAFSALQLAGLYFEKKEYTYAQAYYDSTMMFLPKDYPDYDVLNDRKIILTELVTNLLIVQTEDSLQKLAAMSSYERNKLIDNYIEELKYKEKKAKEAETLRQENMQFAESTRQGPRSVTGSGSNKWYFYNTASLGAGRSEFMQKWGNRKLEDDWRRSDKQSRMEDMSMNGSDEEGGEDDADGDTSSTSASAASNDKYSRDYYLQNIPLSEQMMDSSNFKIERALFNMGIIYKEKLKNTDEAANSFEKLIDRYPKGDYAPQTYYHLYQLYNQQGITSEANRYKKLLIQEFPESDYAKILQDPKYFDKLAKEANRAKDFYKETYQLYLAGKYKNVKLNNNLAKKYHTEEVDLLAKFEMLNALCIGKTTSDTAAFITALNVVVNDYPNSEVKPVAVDIIKSLQEASSPNKEGKKSDGSNGEDDAPATIYVYNSGETHMFMILADQRNLKIRELTKRLSNHNKKYFGLKDLKVKTLPINEDILLVSVGNFDDKAASLKYFKTIRRNTVLYGMIKRVGGNYFVISRGNYQRLYQSKDLDGYRKFFDSYYPEGK